MQRDKRVEGANFIVLSLFVAESIQLDIIDNISRKKSVFLQ